MKQKIIILVSIAAVQCGLVMAGTAGGMFGDMWPAYAVAENSAATTTNIASATEPAGLTAAPNNPPAETTNDAAAGNRVYATNAAIIHGTSPGNNAVANGAPGDRDAKADNALAEGHSAATITPVKADIAASPTRGNHILGPGAATEETAGASGASAKGSTAADKAAAGNDIVIGDLVKNVVVANNAPGKEEKVTAHASLSKADAVKNHPPVNDKSVASNSAINGKAVPGVAAGGSGVGRGAVLKKDAGVKSVAVHDTSTPDKGSARSEMITRELMQNVIGANNTSVKQVKVAAHTGQVQKHGTAHNAPVKQTVTASDGLFRNYVARNNAHAAEDLMANNAPLAGSASPGLPPIQLPSSGSGNASDASQSTPGLPAITAPQAGPGDNSGSASDNSDSSSEDASDEVTNLMYSLDDQYRLGPGDTIVYQVVEDQDSPTNLVLTDSGDLEVPYYGLVHAGGKTCQELAEQVKSLLEKNLYYQATVVIALGIENKNWVTGKVYVTGQVKNPGSFPIPSTEDMTVSKAILAAGGFSDFSDQKHVRLIRKGAAGDQAYIINVVDIWKGNVSKDLEVQPGDMVVVPARLINY